MLVTISKWQAFLCEWCTYNNWCGQSLSEFMDSSNQSCVPSETAGRSWITPFLAWDGEEQGGSDYNARRWNLLSIVVENSAAGAREIRVSGFISSVNWSCRSVVLWSKRIIETSEASVCIAAFFDPLLTLHSGGCHIIWGLIDSEGHLETFKYGVLAQLDDPIDTCDWIRTLSFLAKIEVEDVNGWSISYREYASFRWISGRVGVEILWVTLWE